jgi:signal transduction histidine kinase
MKIDLSLQSQRQAILTGLSGLLVALVLWWTAPLNAVPEVPPSAVQVFAASEVDLPRQQAAADSVATLNQRRTLGTEATTQYHMTGDRAALSEMVMVAAAGGPATLYVNAIAIEKSNVAVLPGPVRGGELLVASIPATLLNAQSNRMDVLIGQDPWRVGIAGVRLGSGDVVRTAVKAHEQRQGFVLAVMLIAGVVGFLSMVLLLAVSQARLALAGSALISVTLLLVTGIGVGFVSESLVSFLALWIGPGLIVGAVLAGLGAQTFPEQVRGPWLGLCAVALVAGILSMIGWRLSMPLEFVAALTESASVLLVGAGVPMVVIATSRKLVVERAEARALAARQSVMVADQAAQLQRQAEAQAVTDERKRFARDIHDGIGGQLVSLLWRARYEPIPQDEMVAEIEQGIADLRLVVDALDEGPVSLPVALSNFAHRARQQLDAAGIAFEWDIPRDFDLTWSDPRAILNFYRVLQEAVANSVRHAKAKTVSIKVDCPHNDGRLRVLVVDDGIGFNPAIVAGGRGLANLKSRTSAMGGAISFDSAPGKGTKIVIELPPQEALVV